MDGKKRSWCTFLTSAEKQKWDLRAFTASVVGRLLQLSVLHLPRQPEATRDRCAAQQGVGLVCITGVTFVSSVRVTHVLMLLVCGGKKGTNKQSEKKNISFFLLGWYRSGISFLKKRGGGGGREKLKEKDTKHGQHRVAVPSPRHLSRTAFPVPQERGWRPARRGWFVSSAASIRRKSCVLETGRGCQEKVSPLGCFQTWWKHLPSRLGSFPGLRARTALPVLKPSLLGQWGWRAALQLLVELFWVPSS